MARLAAAGRGCPRQSAAAPDRGRPPRGAISTTNVSRRNSRRKKALQGFAGAGIFQSPAAVRLAFKMQLFGQRFYGERGGELQPAKRRRLRPASAEAHVARRKFYQPAV